MGLLEGKNALVFGLANDKSIAWGIIQAFKREGMFIKRYGPDVFRQVREAVLQMIQPNAQTEGILRGQGGGMDDQVMGMIGAQQPVAVSPGEYIVPADVGSGLGDGSSDAGAQELDKMSQNIPMARGGSAMQPPALDASRYLPA